MAERNWVEINSRVNYPLKSCLRDLEEVGDINMNDPVHKYCTSWFTIRVANVGTSAAVKSWNEHCIPSKCCACNVVITVVGVFFHSTGKGIPNLLMTRNNRAAHVNQAVLPYVDDAFQCYTSLGGSLTEPHPFGCDPLEGNTHLQQIRHDVFFEKYNTFDPFFHRIVNGDDSLFREGLKLLIDTTQRLSV